MANSSPPEEHISTDQLESSSFPYRFRSIAIVIGLLAVLIRLAPLMRSNLDFAFIHDDSFWYIQTADGLKHGCGFARLIDGACAPAEVMRTPGYPLFLTVMPSTRWALAAQAVIGGVVSILVALWVARSWGIGAALLAEFLIAFDLPSVVLANQIMAEEFFQLMLLLAFVPPLMVISHATKRFGGLTIAALSGLAAACAILIRPIAIATPILMPIPFLFARNVGRRRIAMAAMACAFSAIALSGWILRNYEVADYLGLSTSASINLYYYRAVEVEARRSGTSVDRVKYAFGRKLGVPWEHIFDANVQSPQLVSRMNRLSREVIMHAPLQAVLMTILNTVYISTFPIRTQLADVVGTSGGVAGSGLSSGNPSLGRFATEIHRVLQSPVLTMLLVFQTIMTLVVWIGIFLAMLRCRQGTREYRAWTIYLTLVSLIMIVLAAGGEADVRFREPVVPLLAIVAALGYFPALKPWRANDRESRALLAAENQRLV